MGKQISFFMNEQDEQYFVQKIIKSADLLIRNKLDPDRNIQIVDKVEQDKKYLLQYCIYYKDWSLIVNDNAFIDRISSEVIEFDVSYTKENRMYPGRLWVEMKYWAENKELVTKRPELEEKYKLYKKYITKNYRISKDKHYYIGPGAYELYKQGWKMMSGPKYEVAFD